MRPQFVGAAADGTHSAECRLLSCYMRARGRLTTATAEVEGPGCACVGKNNDRTNS